MSKMKRLAKKVLLSLAASMISASPSAFALPDQGAYDNSAYASIVINGNVMNIAGNYGNNIINWRTFSVASGETVKFADKNNYLNLVNGIDTSIINGTISGGGIVYLINPYGILFGSGATLDNVGSFVASTRDISDVNQEAFINDPSKVQNVLYSNDHASRNKDYYPDNSPFVPTISVADLQLTNVPASATQIVLDSPGGVILKDTATLDKTLFVSTQKNGGEIGIGFSNEILAEAAEHSQTIPSFDGGKIRLFDGSDWYSYSRENNPDIVQPYKQIHNINELQAINQEAKNNSDNPKRYLLENDIDASGFNFKPLGSDNNIWRAFNNSSYTEKGFYGVLDGLGYKISNLTTTQGLFSSFSGQMRNLSIENVHVDNELLTGMAGGVAGYFNGSMSNVHCTSGYVSVRGDGGGLVGLAFVDGVDGLPNDIRNSSNRAEIHAAGSGGGIAGSGSTTYVINSYNMGNIDHYRAWLIDSGTMQAGGIIGANTDDYNKGVYILATYNTGTVDGSDNVGGICGYLDVPVGDSYNFGKIRTNDHYFLFDDRYPDVQRRYGGISGLQSYTYNSKITNEPLKSYYFRNFEDRCWIYQLNFGEELSAVALQAKFDENQRNHVATIGVTTPVIPNYPSTANGNPVGSNTGGNTNNRPKDNETPKNANSPIASNNSSSASTNTQTNHHASIILPVLRDAAYNNALTAKDEMQRNATDLYNSNINGTSGASPAVHGTPALTEDVTESARIFHVNPGYQQGGYYKEEGGLFVTNLNVDQNRDKPITFDLYNTKDAMGIIEYYDESGKFIRADRIEPHDTVIKDFDSWWEKAKNTADSIAKYGFNGAPITHPINSEHKSVEAPKGTYRIVVTNNINESVYAQAYHFVDSFFTAQSLYKNVKTLIKDYDAFESDLAANSLIENVKENLAERIIQQMQKNIVKMDREGDLSQDNMIQDTLKSLFKSYGKNGVKNLALQGFDLQEAFQDTLEYAINNSGKIALGEVKGMATGVCKGLLKGNPAIFGLDAMKFTGNLLDAWSKSMTEKQLEKVKPMIFQIEAIEAGL